MRQVIISRVAKSGWAGMFTTLTLAGSSLDRHDGHGDTFKRDDSL
jgi:hypothetical protein